MNSKDFEGKLTALINSESMENASNTPDFLLTRYLMACLEAWNATTAFRDNWYGKSTDESKVTHDQHP
jgi:uncharacterized protein involved in tolerance to divalent cations